MCTHAENLMNPNCCGIKTQSTVAEIKFQIRFYGNISRASSILIIDKLRVSHDPHLQQQFPPHKIHMKGLKALHSLSVLSLILFKRTMELLFFFFVSWIQRSMFLDLILLKNSVIVWFLLKNKKLNSIEIRIGCWVFLDWFLFSFLAYCFCNFFFFTLILQFLCHSSFIIIVFVFLVSKLFSKLVTSSSSSWLPFWFYLPSMKFLLWQFSLIHFCYLSLSVWLDPLLRDSNMWILQGGRTILTCTF